MSPQNYKSRYKYINHSYYEIAIVFGVIVFLSGCSFGTSENKETVEERDVIIVQEIENIEEAYEDIEEIEEKVSITKEPLINAQKRITKKPFGLYVTPENSLVQPERFSGYHTGTDFEVFADELENDVLVFAICDGVIESKQIVDGYGGVIVQSCIIDDEEMRILYGHVSLPQTFVTVGAGVVAGEKISTLGKHKSVETDGERKHLHLGIMKGDRIDLRGYVQNDDELAQWVDYEQLVSTK